MLPVILRVGTGGPATAYGVRRSELANGTDELSFTRGTTLPCGELRSCNAAAGFAADRRGLYYADQEGRCVTWNRVGGGHRAFEVRLIRWKFDGEDGRRCGRARRPGR